MQLDLLLQSIARYAPFLRPRVFWTASSTVFELGYSACITEHPRVSWWRQQVFAARVRRAVDSWRQICFLVDDDVFFRPAPADPLPLPFSYRLDGDTVWADHEAYSDEGYPLALDGHVYDTATLPPLDFPFENPTQLEAGMDSLRHLFQPDTLHGYRCLVGIPANRVSESSNMPYFGWDHGLTAEGLATRYLWGERIDLDATFRDVEVTAAHQEIHYVIR